MKDTGQYACSKPAFLYTYDLNLKGGKEIVVDDVVYAYTVDAGSNIDFLLTADTNFFTPDGLRIGDRISLIDDYARRAKIRRGWGTAIPLPSGWNAYCGKNGRAPDTLAPDDTIGCFFKVR